MSSPAIEVRGLRKRFTGRKQTVDALKDVSFSVPSGSIYGFLGPNGAGKTTTLRILTGLLQPTAGDLRLLGETVTYPGGPTLATRRRLAYLPQDPVFPARLNAFEVMELVAELYRLPRRAAAERSQKLLADFELLKDAKRSVKSFSRGMKQRLGLAAVLLPEPDLLLLDEPVSALDPVGRYEVLTRLAALRGRATVFFSTHILADVERICDRVLIIHQGSKVAEGDMGELLARFTPPRYRVRTRPDQVELAAATLNQQQAEGKLPWLLSVELESGAASKETNQEAPALNGDSSVLLVTAQAGRRSEMEAELLRVLVNSGITVLEYSPVRPDLESVFLQLLPETERPGFAEESAEEERDVAANADAQ
ncbi:MAG: ABC transporter ATP-binding protein [Limnochordales bacterium]|nr:ABC transporter ATP-binding protein [Limnochordales bacterium]